MERMTVISKTVKQGGSLLFEAFVTVQKSHGQTYFNNFTTEIINFMS